MYNIIQGFEDNQGNKYSNIRNIHINEKKDLMNIGTFKTETKFNNLQFFSSSFKRENGVYIYQSFYDNNKALRIYKNFANYKMTNHNDAKIISELQKKQEKIKLTDFPTGIVSIENKVIGQEISYYENFYTIADAIINGKIIVHPTIVYLEILKILKELINNGVIYCDIHTNNFMINLTNNAIKLIDFEPSQVAVDESVTTYSYKKMINNLKRMLNDMSVYYQIPFNNNFNKCENLEHIEECIREKQCTLLKK